MYNKRIAIILINWNSFQYTWHCILSLNKIPQQNFTILVIDNGSGDDSATKLIQTFPEIVLIRAGKNLGFSGGNNLGLQYAIDHGYEYSLLLNNDTEVTESFLSVLSDYMDAHTEVGAIQPKIYYYHNRNLIWNDGAYFQPVLGITYTPGHGKIADPSKDTIKPVDWITGCGFFIRNTVLQKTGLLANEFFLYYEDVDLSFRIKKAGYSLIYHPGSVIYHIAGVATRKTEKEKEGFLDPMVHYYNTRNHLWLLRKHLPFLYIPTATLYTFLYTIAIMGYFVCRLRFTKAKAVWKGIKDGLK